LFAGTVAENIARLGNVNSDKVVQAAKRAGVHELILTLPEGYDTVINGSGVMLSPGQRQRIALARALYGDPKLLVLDEPNSNLDGAGELALAEALKALKGQVTVIVVTHRTTLVQHMDKMLVLDAGRVQQYGSVTEVLQAMQKGSQKAGGGQVVVMPRTAGAATSAVQGAAPADCEEKVS
jgi:ABC-type protease/lipase transport system fused ATPase/permease subunit